MKKWTRIRPYFMIAFAGVVVLLCAFGLRIAETRLMMQKSQKEEYQNEIWNQQSAMLSRTDDQVTLEDGIKTDPDMDASMEDMSESLNLSGQIPLEDGLYFGKGKGYRGDVYVAVAVQQHRMELVDIVDYVDDDAFFSRAKKILELVITEQSTELDAISGATYSSKGILAAIDDALTGKGQINFHAATKDKAEMLDEGDVVLKDGTFEGVGNGFRGQIHVRVLVNQLKIESVEVTGVDADDMSYVERAKGVIDQIIQKQSLKVDAVSGATYSSRGIVAAVRNALTGEADDSVMGAGNVTAQGTATMEKVKEESRYKDGTYTGKGTGFGGELTVKVTIKEGKISSITIVSHQDGQDYMNSASKLCQTMIKKQTTNVDAVSGATYSSAGLVQAVRDALAKASESSEKDEKEEKEETKEGKFPYPDGIYYGSADGFQSEIQVAVVIQNKTIKAILITEQEETEQFFDKAKTIAETMVKKQKINVDAVSGATYSSNGIKNAVKAAIKNAKAGKSGLDHASDNKDTNAADSNDGTNEKGQNSTDSQQTSDSQNADKNETESESPSAGEPLNTGLIYQDGSYAGQAICEADEYEDFENYTISLIITVLGDKIIAIDQISGDGDQENDPFIKRAQNGFGKKAGVVAQIVEKGSAEQIDAVSGATCSSKAIAKACQNALTKAKVE